MNNIYKLICHQCKNITESYKDWLKNNQACNKCNCILSFIKYDKFDTDCFNEVHAKNIWVYKNNLPLDDSDNITSLNEGTLEVENWKSLQLIAEKYFSISCKIYTLRNDNNPGTGTFKDLAGTVISSVLKELKIKNYVVASTGNIGAALSRYLAINNISFYAFIPEDSSTLQESEIRSNGATVFRVNGDYAKAKILAKEFALKNNYLLGGSGVDPLRIEAKKTMIYEYFRQKKLSPTIYIQAVSGGTGPIGVYKGSSELQEHGLIESIPKLFLYQSNSCSPMANAFKKASSKGFPEGWHKEYQIISNPDTEITTLATGDPTLYPFLSEMVYKSQGYIDSVSEENVFNVFKFIALNETVKIGPAACIAILGLLKALSENKINNGDEVLINIGEGAKRTPGFFEGFSNNELVNNISDIKKLTNIDDNRKQSINLIEEIITKL